MLITIQYPLADARPFLPNDGGRLECPSWPAARVDTEFVRSFGGVQKRLRGGLPGWVGEGIHCQALRGLRFKSGQPGWMHVRDLGLDTDSRIRLRVAFRRIYADGLALAKAELGFAVSEKLARNLSARDVKALIEQILATKLSIPGIASSDGEVSVGNAGKLLAQSYCSATTSRSYLARGACKSWWVTSGLPILFWESGPIERIHIPYRCRTVPPEYLAGINLNYTEVRDENGIKLPIWFLSIGLAFSRIEAYHRARELRICLLRLHAECECLRIILQHLAKDRLKIEPRSKLSDVLQFYLNRATRKISGLAKTADEISETELAEIAREAINAINPTERSEILYALETIDIRKNIFHKVDKFVSTKLTIQNLLMETYNISGGQQGAVGHGAISQNATFNQVVQTIDGKSLAELASELGQLRSVMKSRASQPEQDIAVSAIAEAESAARSEDRTKVAALLAKGGKWALDIAKEIGVPIASRLLESSMGLKP